MLERCISGFQTGADFGGILAAKNFGIATGGTMPKGFINHSGPHPEYAELYGAEEHPTSSKYPPRTMKNIFDADATIRLAYNFISPGEQLTLTGIQQMKKPYIDVNLAKPRPVDEVVAWLNKFNVKILNVAGNSERTYSGITGDTIEYMSSVFSKMGLQPKA